MPNPTWTPCEVGLPLYQAAYKEHGTNLVSINPDAWAKWKAHRDNCEKCSSYKEQQ